MPDSVIRRLGDARLDQVTGGAVRPKFVSSFYCEKCSKTIHLNGVYSLERAQKDHDAKEHAPKKK